MSSSQSEMNGEKKRTKFRSGFICGITCSIFLWLCVRYVPCFGLGFYPIPRFDEIQPGMTYQQVAQILGEEDGNISGKELASYDQHRYVLSETPPEFQKPSSEIRHLFWLSKSNCLLIFNVVSIDKEDAVVSTYVGYDTYFGIK